MQKQNSVIKNYILSSEIFIWNETIKNNYRKKPNNQLFHDSLNTLEFDSKRTVQFW